MQRLCANFANKTRLSIIMVLNTIQTNINTSPRIYYMGVFIYLGDLEPLLTQSLAPPDQTNG